MQGKYCLVRFPLDQNPEIGDNQFANSKMRSAISDLNMTGLNIPWGQLKMQISHLDKETTEDILNFQKLKILHNNFEKR